VAIQKRDKEKSELFNRFLSGISRITYLMGRVSYDDKKNKYEEIKSD
jgi:hypothetical protein